MLHFKCPTCKKIIPAPDEAASEDATCMDCGSKLILLKPVSDAAGKAKENPVPEPGSNKNRRSSDEDDETKPQLKSRKKKPKREGDEDEEVELKKKSKKRGAKKSERDGDEDRPSVQMSNAEGENILGPVKQIFTSGNETLRIVAILCVVLAVAGMLSCILSMIATMPNGTMLFTVIAIPGGLGGLFWCMKSLTFKVTVHAGGIVHSHRGKSQIVPWEEISSITQAIAEVTKNGSHVGTTYVYTLALTDRSQIVYTNKLIKDIEKLGNILLEKTSGIILPQVRVKYELGERYDFGRLSINAEGIHYRKDVMRWRDIEAVKISEGYIVMHQQVKWVRWCNIAASSIPNLHVFLTIANEILDANSE